MKPGALLWLDLFPRDLNFLIVAHLTNCKQNQLAINLALSSPTQRDAVLHAMGNSLIVNASEDQNDREICRYLTNGPIDTVRFTQTRGSPFSRNIIQTCIRSKIRYATIYDDSMFMRALATSSIVELEVLLFHGIPPRSLLTTLQKLKLTSLSLICQVHDPRRCPFRRDGTYASANSAIRQVFASLRSLQMTCDCDKIQKGFPLWNVLPAVPKSCEVTIFANPPREVEDLLIQFRAIRVHEVRNGSRMVHKFGFAITEMYRPRDMRSPIELMALYLAVDLRALVVNISERAEKALVRVVPRLKKLCKLDLCWDQPPDAHSTNSNYQCHPYAKAVPGALLQIMRDGRRLSDLRLAYVDIDRAEVLEFLEEAGRRLTYVAIPIAARGDEPLERLHVILEAIIKYNPALRTLKVEELPDDVLRKHARENSAVRGTAEQLKRWSSVVQKKMPLLDMTYVNFTIDRILAEKE